MADKDGKDAGKFAEPMQDPTEEDEIQNISDELAQMDAEPAVPSTIEYYQTEREKSYPINPSNLHRGRAIIFTMTENREGWKADVRALHRLFLSLNISTQHVFNPTAEKIRHELSSFAMSEDNKKVDCVFVTFMGHGYGEGNNCFLQTKSIDFDIWSNCSHIFNTAATILNSKPKVFLAQICRGEEIGQGVKLKTAFRFRSKRLKDYIVAFASQPGELAQRRVEGSVFIQTFATILTGHSHKIHVEAMLKLVQRMFAVIHTDTAYQGQMPQLWSVALYEVNLFPGITESALREVQSVALQAADGTRAVAFEHEPVLETSPVPNQDGPDLIIRLQGILFPAEPDKAPMVQMDFFNKRKSKEFQEKLSKLISEETDIPLAVNGVDTGSIQLYCKMADYSQVDDIKDLCDTGILGNIVQTLLVTPDMVKKYSLHFISITCRVDEKSYKEILEYLKEKGITRPPMVWQLADNSAFLQEEVYIECEAEGHVRWYKDEILLKESQKISIVRKENSCCLRIKDIQISDSGLYRCQYDQPQPTITECRLGVFDQGCPTDVKASPVAATAALITWRATIGNVSGYKVIYSLQRDLDIHGSVMVEGQGTESAIISGLLPGQVYNVSVVSMSGLLRSNVSASGSATLNLPSIHSALVTATKPLLLKSLNVDKTVKHMAEQDYISEDQKAGIEKHSSNTDKVNAFMELLTASSEEMFLKFLFALYQTDQAETAEFLCSLHMYQTKVKNEIRTMQEEGDMNLTAEIGEKEEHLFQTEDEPFHHQRLSGRKASEYVRSLPVPRREEDLETVSSFALTEISQDSGYLSGQTSLSPKARVTERHQGQDDTELTLEVGDIITIKEQNEDGMWTGTLGAETGLFPSRCVKMIDLNAPSQAQREADETALKQEVQALISKQRDEKQNLDKLEDRILDLSKTLNSLEVSRGRTEEQVHTIFHVDQSMYVKKKDPCRSGTPAVFTARWQVLRNTVLPQHVKAVLLDTVRLGACTESVFSYVEQCHNLNNLSYIQY